MNEAVSLIIAYLLGSIPFGYLLVRYLFSQGKDIRQFGSGSTGATNVGRLAGAKGALLTYVMDVSKGVAAVYIARSLSHSNLWWMGAAGILAIAGHMFPVWIGFRGGKGVATGVGVFLVLSPFAVLSALFVWAGVVSWKRYVALGSIVAAAVLPLWVLFWEGGIAQSPPERLKPLLLTAIIGGTLIITKHHENIRRLLNGMEDRIGNGRGLLRGNKR